MTISATIFPVTGLMPILRVIFLPVIHPLNEVKAHPHHVLVFDASRNTSLITADRRNKYPSPICFFIHAPDDIQNSIQKVKVHILIYKGCFHETGHAIHAVN